MLDSLPVRNSWRSFLLLFLFLAFVSPVSGYSGVGSLNVKCSFNYDEDRFVMMHPTLDDMEVSYLDHRGKHGQSGDTGRKAANVNGKFGVNNFDSFRLPGFLSAISQHLEFQPKKNIEGWRSKDGDKLFRRVVNELTKGNKKVSWIEYHGQKWFARFEEIAVNQNHVILFDQSRDMWVKLTALGNNSPSSLYWARSQRFKDIKKWSYLEDGIWNFVEENQGELSL